MREKIVFDSCMFIELSKKNPQAINIWENIIKNYFVICV